MKLKVSSKFRKVVVSCGILGAGLADSDHINIAVIPTHVTDDCWRPSSLLMNGIYVQDTCGPGGG